MGSFLNSGSSGSQPARDLRLSLDSVPVRYKGVLHVGGIRRLRPGILGWPLLFVFTAEKGDGLADLLGGKIHCKESEAVQFDGTGGHPTRHTVGGLLNHPGSFDGAFGQRSR